MTYRFELRDSSGTVTVGLRISWDQWVQMILDWDMIEFYGFTVWLNDREIVR